MVGWLENGWVEDRLLPAYNDVCSIAGREYRNSVTALPVGAMKQAFILL
jgi:hypothetical protein